MLANKLEGAASAVPVFVEDVFSTYLYDGNDSTQTITNGIDLSGKGGLVWIKSRGGTWGTTNHSLFDTSRGITKTLATNTTSGQATQSGITAFNTNGFSLGTEVEANGGSTIYTSWTFRKQSKFFDIVTYTGNGTNRTIAHNLGSVPGCIIVKRTDTSGFDWQVYHRSLANTEYMLLNTTAAKATGTTRWNSTTPTSTEFSLGTSTAVNADGGTYVAYLFAHDAGGFGAAGTDNVISCGSYTTSTGGVATVNLGFEPQWVLAKYAVGSSGDWYIFDGMRGFNLTSDSTVSPNLSAAESTVAGGLFAPNATGFTDNGWFSGGAGATIIYIAIRRGLMKTPTDATKVFTPTVYTGTNADNRLVNTTIAPDMVWIRQRNSTTVAGMVVGDRLRGQPYLLTGSNAAEVNDADSFDAQLVSAVEYGTAFSSMSGVWVGNDATSQLNASTISNNQIVEAFKRAQGFFDVVCYTGTGVARTVNHNLGVVPELIIIKRRNTSDTWIVYYGNKNKYLELNTNSMGADTVNTHWNNTSPTSTVFSLGTSPSVNSSSNYIAYLFASCPGVSKVGSYTGTNAQLNISCGFSGSARFVLIKRTDSTGDWYIYDSARGMSDLTDPYLLLNSTAAEDNANVYVTQVTGGFRIKSGAPAAINALNGTFIYLAIA